MYYGIVENNRFFLIDEDKETILNTLPCFPEKGYSETDIQTYEESDVEQGYDLSFYLKGFAPRRPLEEREEERRRERNALLAATDKYFISDYPITEEERERYRQYRQYLRDIPQQLSFPNVGILNFEQWKENGWTGA